MKKSIICLLAFIFFIPFSFANEAKIYNIISQNDSSFSGRQRVQIFILSNDAKTLQQRVDTSKVAATDYSVKTGAKVVSVFLVPSKQLAGTGYNFVVANYYSDGCGNSGTQCNSKQWEIQATDQQLTDLELKIANEFYTNSNKFLDKYGQPDEDKLINYIAKKLKISVDEVDFPVLFLEPIE